MGDCQPDRCAKRVPEDGVVWIVHPDRPPFEMTAQAARAAGYLFSWCSRECAEKLWRGNREEYETPQLTKYEVPGDVVKDFIAGAHRMGASARAAAGGDRLTVGVDHRADDSVAITLVASESGKVIDQLVVDAIRQDLSSVDQLVRLMNLVISRHLQTSSPDIREGDWWEDRHGIVVEVGRQVGPALWEADVVGARRRARCIGPLDASAILSAGARLVRRAGQPVLPEGAIRVSVKFEDADPDRVVHQFKEDLDARAKYPPREKGQRWRLGSATAPGAFEFTLGERGHRDVPRGTNTGDGWEMVDCTVPSRHQFAYDVWWSYQDMALVSEAPVVQPCSACGETPPEGRTHYCPAVPRATKFLSDSVLRAHVEGRAAETGVKPCCVIGGVYQLRGSACPFHGPKPEAAPPWAPEQDPFGYRST